MVLCDLDEPRLRKTLACVEFARKSSPRTGKLSLGASMHVLDLSPSSTSMQDLAGIVTATHGKCDMVFNVLDSGAAAATSFSGSSLADIQAALQRELGLTVSLCKLLLPILLRQTSPCLVNVSVQPFSQSTMSSLAVAGLSATLQLEHPSLRVAHATALAPCSPKTVVAELLHKVLETREHKLVLGQHAQVLDWCTRLWPEFALESDDSKRAKRRWWLVWTVWVVSRWPMGQSALLALLVGGSLNRLQAWLNRVVERAARLH